MNNKFNLPSQKISDRQKTKAWYKKNLDSIDSNGFFEDEGVRASFSNRRINYDLYNGVLNMKDVFKILNPHDLQGLNLERSIQHYPIAVPRLNVLLGEELKRRFDYKVIVTNPDAVSAKEESKLQVYLERVQAFMEQNYSEKQLEKKLKELQDEMNYSWQDHREVIANRLLQHLFQEQDLDKKFNDGFLDALIAGEEYYMAEIVSGEPVLKKLDTDSVYWVRSGFSNRIDDSDLIIIDEYWSPGSIIDHFHSELKPSEIDKLEKGFTSSGDPGRATDNAPQMLLAETKEDERVIEDLIDQASSGYTLNRSIDNHGNIRVLRVYWRSFRQVKKVKSYDEFGDEQYDYYPSNYQPNTELGETASTIWINEWLEGTKIGDDIYVGLRPKPVQYHKLDNPSYCHPGIVGGTYSVGKNRTVSPMDRVKRYQYQYDVTFDRLNTLLANNKGKVLVMDFSSIPSEWEPEQWFTYLNSMNIAVKDSFREGAKGASTGHLAGNLGRGGEHSQIDLDQSQAIAQYISILEFLKTQMSEILGVSDQRMGQIQNRETIGGVERSITQSSHITEWYFFNHDKIKIDALEILLDTAKIAYKGKNKKVQYILDDQNIQMLNVDGDDFSSNEYGLVITTSSKSQELERAIQEGAYALMQRGELQLSSLIDIFSSSSIADKRNKIERREVAKAEEDKRRFDQEMQLRKEESDKKYELELLKLELEDLKSQRDTKIKAFNTIQMEEDDERLELDEKKLKETIRQFDEDIAEKKRQFNEKIQIERKKATQKKA